MPKRPEVCLIAAVASNGVIGDRNTLPWRLPEDLQRFKRLTMGCPVLMGRKTFLSLGRPLPGRRNLVVSRDSQCCLLGAEVFASPVDAIASCSGVARIFLIGGAELYQQMLAQADCLFLTHVELAPEGDAHFPSVDWTMWCEVAREQHVDAASGIPFTFVDYRRADPL